VLGAAVALRKSAPLLTISSRQARHFLSAHQNLSPPGALQGKAGALEHLRRVR